MFTGIIQALGHIEQSITAGDDIKLQITTDNLDLSDTVIGDSIAVNGVCLTVVALSKNGFETHVSKETLSRTAGLNHQGHVNLEKAIRLSDRLGGHLVSGHVDGIGQVVKLKDLGDCWHLMVRAPHDLMRYIAEKGSIAVDGVSLTVNALEHDTFSVNLIPHTIMNTCFQHAGVGSRVNLEIDLIARYTARIADWDKAQQGDSA